MLLKRRLWVSLTTSQDRDTAIRTANASFKPYQSVRFCPGGTIYGTIFAKPDFSLFGHRDPGD